LNPPLPKRCEEVEEESRLKRNLTKVIVLIVIALVG